MNIQVISPAAARDGALLIPARSAEEGLLRAEALLGARPADFPQKGLFSGRHKERLWLAPASEGKPWACLLGLGEQPSFAQVQSAFRSFAHASREALPALLEVDMEGRAEWAEAAVSGLLLGRYQIGSHKEPKAALPDFLAEGAQLRLLGGDAAVLAAAAARGQAFAETQLRIFDLVNAPSNHLRPADLGTWAAESGQRFGYHVSVLEKRQLESLGMHALLAVGRGSEFPPVMIVAEYRPEGLGSDAPHYGLVGKGVTFDTGGVSLKDPANMHWMKSDMAGAAAVLGAVEVAARLGLRAAITAVVPATENCIGSKAIKPGDIIRSYSGKSIEVLDTDAEGRLILADGLAYLLQNYPISHALDLATLTGNCIQALGYHAAGLFTSNDAWASRIVAAGERCGERTWRLPLWDVYFDDMKSDMADLRNLSGKPVAGAITAAKFLEAFVGDFPAWAHLDIAGVAFSDSEFAASRSATAWGVRLIGELLGA